MKCVTLLAILCAGLLVVGCRSVAGDGSGEGSDDGGSGTDTDTSWMACDKGVWAADFHTIENEADIATIAGYTEVSGTLTIESPDLTSLSGLECLTSVGWELWIWKNPALTNLTGLEALTSVGGNLEFENNPALTSLTGLEALTSVGESLNIYNNDALTSLVGLEGITSIGGNLLMSYNEALPDCEVCDLLEQLSSGPGDIDIENNLSDACTPVPDNCP